MPDFRYRQVDGGYAIEFQQKNLSNGLWMLDLGNDPREHIQTLSQADYNNPPATPVMANFASAIVSLLVAGMHAGNTALDIENPTIFQWSAFQAIEPLLELAGYSAPYPSFLLSQIWNAFQYTSTDVLDAIDNGLNIPMACDIYCVLDTVTGTELSYSAWKTLCTNVMSDANLVSGILPIRSIFTAYINALGRKGLMNLGYAYFNIGLIIQPSDCTCS